MSRPNRSVRPWLRVAGLLSVVLAIGVLAYFTFRTTFQIERLRRQSVLEATLALASEKADRLDQRIVEEDNVAMALVDPLVAEELPQKWLPTSGRETPTIRALLVLNESREVIAFASRAGGPWEEEESFRHTLVRRMIPDMKLDEQPLDELRHLHHEYSGRSYLVSHWKRSAVGHTYLIVAWHDLGRIVRGLFPLLYSEGSGSTSKVSVLDEEGRIIFGPQLRSGGFSVNVRFPTTIYDWRLQVTPTGSEELAGRVRARHLLELVVFVFSFLVIVVSVVVTLLAARRERKISHLKSEFAANVSHELRTPLSLIRMFAELLESNRVSSEEKRKEYLSIIVHESERLTALIENVLDFARLERDKQAYEMSSGNLAEPIRRAAGAFRYPLEQRGLTLVVDAEEELSHPAFDERAIQLAVTNLVDNAIKYAKGGTRIVLAATIDETHLARITVTDDGPGVPEADRSRIFERFERAISGDDGEKIRGSGIGLAIVRHIAESHGGRAWVEDGEGGKGARFILEIPAIGRTNGRGAARAR